MIAGSAQMHVRGLLTASIGNIKDRKLVKGAQS